MAEIPKIPFKGARKIDDFEAVDVGELMVKRSRDLDHDPTHPHQLLFYAILIAHQRPVRHWLDFREYHLQAGDSLLIARGQVHAFSRHPAFAGGELILFTENFLLRHVGPSTLAKITRLYNYDLNQAQYSNPAATTSFAEQLHHELQRPHGILQGDILAHLLALYLLRIEADHQSQSTNYRFDRQYELFAAFRSLVATHYVTTRNARDFAEQLDISYKHLNEICKSFTRRTAKAFIDAHVVLEAKRKLVATSLSVKEIAFSCGFDEPTNFLKYFRNRTGKTPVTFREELARG
ncbi:MAG: helix-turn-helix transcriptional regulator [Bacteroidota bacterium]